MSTARAPCSAARLRLTTARRATVCAAAPAQSGALQAALGRGLCSLALCQLLAAPALAEVRLPPIDTDPLRCERGYVGNTIGQANAVSDKLLDLRSCTFDGKSLAGKTLSGALMGSASFKGSDLSETVMSKARRRAAVQQAGRGLTGRQAYAVDANFDKARFNNAVLDRVIFNGSSMKAADFTNGAPLTVAPTPASPEPVPSQPLSPAASLWTSTSPMPSSRTL